jgi:hypothetical protein
MVMPTHLWTPVLTCWCMHTLRLNLYMKYNSLYLIAQKTSPIHMRLKMDDLSFSALSTKVVEVGARLQNCCGLRMIVHIQHHREPKYPISVLSVTRISKHFMLGYNWKTMIAWDNVSFLNLISETEIVRCFQPMIWKGTAGWKFLI